MSTTKQWTGKEKPTIVLQGLKGDCSVRGLCNEHAITQGMYYKWRDQLLRNAALDKRGHCKFQNKELKKRTRYIKVFRNNESLLRIVTALQIELDES